MTELRTAKQIINTAYAEFPETILHAELCRAMARTDGRSIRKSLQEFGRYRANRVKSDPLRNALLSMSVSMFPEAEITRIRASISRIETALVKNFDLCRR